MANFFVYIDKVYRSEIALFRAEGVSREFCEMVEMPSDTTEIYRLGDGLAFFGSLTEAASAFFANPNDGPMRSNPIVD